MLGCSGETSARRCLRRTREGVLERRVEWPTRRVGQMLDCNKDLGKFARRPRANRPVWARSGFQNIARRRLGGSNVPNCATRRRMSAVANYALRTHEGESQEQGASGAWLGRGAGLLLNLKRTVRTRLVRQCSTRHRVFASRLVTGRYVPTSTCPLRRNVVVGRVQCGKQISLTR